MITIPIWSLVLVLIIAFLLGVKVCDCALSEYIKNLKTRAQKAESEASVYKFMSGSKKAIERINSIL